jgi:hypothetical protein
VAAILGSVMMVVVSWVRSSLANAIFIDELLEEEGYVE